MFSEIKIYDFVNERQSRTITVLKKISEYTPATPGNTNNDDFSKYDTIARNYDWYETQHNTGEYSNINCGLACAVMTAKWYDKNFSAATEEVTGIAKRPG